MIDTLNLKFHHFGLAARDPKQAANFLQLSGYDCSVPIFDPVQNVFLRWCQKQGTPSVEIISPTGSEGPLANILASQTTSFYHLCYEIDLGSSSMVESMRKCGLRIVTVMPPKPAVIFEGRKVSFHIVYGFGLVELLESTLDDVI
jgi:methylmalonyl-CoA/ethylmalonyl-CoA epimerase